MVIFVTDDIAPHVYDIPNTSSELVHCLRFDKKLLGFEIILGSLYLPHESSKYNEEGIYEDIAEDVMYLNAHYDDPLMIVTGDYNARTGVLDDCITIEDAVAECTGINVNDEGLYQSKHNLSDKGIEVRRFNEDKLVNNNGRLLLDFGKGLDLHIVNGRVGNDLGRGKLTCTIP